MDEMISIYDSYVKNGIDEITNGNVFEFMQYALYYFILINILF